MLEKVKPPVISKAIGTQLRRQLPEATFKKPYVIVFDIGGTSSRVGLFTPDGKFMGEPRRFVTPSIKNYPSKSVPELQDELLNMMASEIDRIKRENPELKLARVGVAFAGPIASGGVVRQAPTLWQDKSFMYPLQAELEKRCPGTIFEIQNDITAAAERYGSLPEFQGLRRICVLTVSSGIGNKVYDILLGEVLLDKDGLAGEMGHTVVDFSKDAPLCECGGKGHLGAIASGRAAEALAGKSGVEIARAAKDGDPTALEILDKVTFPLAQAMSHLSAAIGIDKFIIMGGFALGVGEPYMQALKANLHKATFFGRTPQEIEDLVVFGANDDDHGLIGMGLMLQRKSQNEIIPSITQQDNPGVLMRYQLQESYPVINTERVLEPGNQLLAAQCPNKRATVVVDSNVDKLYGERIDAYLRANTISPTKVVLNATETEKEMPAVMQICQAAEEAVAGRRDPFIAFGGGIIQDVTGFAASMFRRGVPFIRVPTTLIGIVDAGVGVKQGVNWHGHKNFLGAFYPPHLVLNDLAFLETLALRQWRCGAAEIIKMGIIRDVALFELLERHYMDFLDRQITGPVRQAIDMAITGMMEELQPNIYEWDLERRVDFGHAFGHILEIQSQFELHHGEAVAIDMALSTHIAYQRGECDEDTLKRILLLLSNIGLPLYHTCCDPSLVWRGLADVVAHRGGKLNLVIPTGIGSAAFLDQINPAELETAVTFMQAEMGKRNA